MRRGLPPRGAAGQVIMGEKTWLTINRQLTVGSFQIQPGSSGAIWAMIRNSLVWTRSCNSLELTADTADHSVLDKLRKIIRLNINIQSKIRTALIINKCIRRKLPGVPVLICQASIKHLSVSLDGLSDIAPTHPKLDHIGMIGMTFRSLFWLSGRGPSNQISS